MLPKPDCKWCRGAGVLIRNKPTGALFLCPCIPVLSDDACRANRNYCDAGIDRLRKIDAGLDRLIKDIGYGE